MTSPRQAVECSLGKYGPRKPRVAHVSSMPARDPFVEVRCLGTDGRGLAVAGMHHRVAGEHKQPVANRLDVSQMLFSTSKSCPSSEKTPAVVTCSIIGSLDGDHGAQHFAPFHLVEGVLHVLEADRLRHEPVEVESALEVQVDE
jgi:hypothetical protein